MKHPAMNISPHCWNDCLCISVSICYTVYTDIWKSSIIRSVSFMTSKKLESINDYLYLIALRMLFQDTSHSDSLKCAVQKQRTVLKSFWCFLRMAESRPCGSGLSYISTRQRPELHIHSLSFSFQVFSYCSVNTSQTQGVKERPISQTDSFFGKIFNS